MNAFFRKLRWLTRRSDKEAELQEELRFHLEEEAEQARREGLTEDEARWAARRELGNLAQVQESTRAAWGWAPLEQVARDAGHGLRQIRRNPTFSALAIATLPYARGPIQEAQLYELLSGAVESLRSLGVVLTGGHTTEGSELALGFAVTGYAEEDRLFQKSGLRPGDLLVLAKPLGSGALLAAWMRGECRAAWFGELVATMLVSNREAGEVFARAGVLACTDVTGFGLAGHLLEMLDASRVSARLKVRDVPLYAGFEEVVAQGIVSSLHRDNARAAYRVEGTAPAWLFDPQTSGGLLGAIRPEAAGAVLEQLRAAGYPVAAVIGEVVPAEGKPAIVLV